MELPPLTDAVIVKRYKRFLADVVLADGREVTAHCPNTGRMTGCWQPGAPVQLSHSDNPRRKLAWTLERVDMGAGWIGVNTHRVNAVVAEHLEKGQLPGLDQYARLRREVQLDLDHHRSRLDLVLDKGPQPDAYIEVKNVTLLQGGNLAFPDDVTARGQKHLHALRQLVASGNRGIMIYALNRPEGDCFEVARAIDPDYADALHQAMAGGVEVIPLRLKHTPTGMQAASVVRFSNDQ
jgi:sugar fermentation stimulation protein A